MSTVNNTYLNNALRLILETDQNLVAATVKRIYWRNPAGSTGYWDAELWGSSVSQVYYDIPNDTLSTTGGWKFHSYAEIDGKNYQGDPVTIDVLDNWRIMNLHTGTH